eukprot:TRINITY_DN3405_c0_g1_i7.p1 TRINITY_DN3405_c0_g1~~TRINITY_DN3405_c0_g1_i7.p1  ORF type:complete len:903 (+),score=187.06 TRINITY_DN3405_c0_g1_i7:28-2709(+)
MPSRWWCVLVAAVATAVAAASRTRDMNDSTYYECDVGVVPTREWTDEAVVLVDNSWMSSSLTIAVAAIIMNAYMGVTVYVALVDEYSMWPELAKGELSACLEVWPSGHGSDISEYVDAGSVLNVGPLGVTGRIGWYFPDYVLDDYPYASNFDTMDVAHQQLVFSAFSNTVYDGPSTWVTHDKDICACNNWNLNVVFTESEEELLELVDNAIAQRRPILFYLWTPHQIFSKYSLVRASLPSYTDACYNQSVICCDYPPDNLLKVASPHTRDDNGAFRFMQLFNLDNNAQIDMLSDVAYHGKSINESACSWVQQNTAVWQLWVVERDNTKEVKLQVVLPVVLCCTFALVVLAAVVLGFATHQIRQRRRMHKINVELELQNKQLRSALMGSDTTDLLNAPAESIIHMLQTFLQDRTWTEKERARLEFAIGMIASRKLYAFNEAADVADNIESDVKAYLFDQILQKKPDVPTAPGDVVSVSDSEVPLDLDMSLLNNVDEWDFSSVDFVMKCDEGGTNPFSLIGTYCMKHHSVFDSVPGLDVPKLRRFMGTAVKMYNDNPYHNKMHACDVFQAVHWMISVCDSVVQFQPMEKFTLLFAAICHDLQHPGLNNNYLIATRDELAINYNDLSCLENFHVSTAFRLLTQASFNFTAQFSLQRWKEFRSMMISCILATDMAKHVELFSEWKAITTSGANFADAPTRLKAMMLILKCGDLANVARPWEQCYAWAHRVQNEFFFQGDKEAGAGLDVSPFMSRTNANIAKMQLAFAEFVTLVCALYSGACAPSPRPKPLFESMQKVFPGFAVPVARIHENIEMWGKQAGGGVSLRRPALQAPASPATDAASAAAVPDPSASTAKLKPSSAARTPSRKSPARQSQSRAKSPATRSSRRSTRGTPTKK